MQRILSGIQPSGQLHIGNYFGMMEPMLRHMASSELYVFIANLHAMTSVQDKERLAQGTLEAAANFLALGLDPERCIFWVQSDVPEVCELAQHDGPQDRDVLIAPHDEPGEGAEHGAGDDHSDK